MILKNLFKGVRNKVMIALAGLTMVFGVGAAVSNVVSAQQNEVVETKAWTGGNIIYCALHGINVDGDSNWSTKSPMTINVTNDTAYSTFILANNAEFTFTFKRNDYGENTWCDNGKTISTALSGFTGGGSSNIKYTGSTIRVKITVQYPYHDSSTIIIETAPYTITFHQNDESGYTLPGYKTYGNAFSIPAPGETPIEEMGASGGRYFVKWNTESNGSGADYLSGASYTDNADLNLYMQQEWYHYWFSLDNGTSWTELTHDDTDKPSGYDRQFRTDIITLPAGKTISFSRTTGSSYTSAEIIAASNWQHNADGGVIKVTASGKIYLKVARDGTHDVWVEGGTGQRWIEIGGTKYEMVKSTDTDWYTTTLVTLMPGDVIKGGYESGSSYNLKIATGDGSFTGGSSVVCNAPGVFTIHIYLTSGVDWEGARFVMDDASSAILFAQVFNSEIGAVCTSIEGGASASTSTLASDWATQDSYFDALTSGAQTAVKSDSGSSNTDVVACRAKYDQVCGKYGPNGQALTGITDFMGRNPKPKTSGAGLIPGAPGNNQSPLTTTLWIVFGCGLAGLGAIGTAYFVSKKKKKNHVA